MEKEGKYWGAYIDMRLKKGRIEADIHEYDSNARLALQNQLQHSHASDWELNIWYDDGHSLILFGHSSKEVWKELLAKLAEIEDRLFKYANLFKRAVAAVESIKQGMEDEEGMLEKYTPEVRSYIKGGLVDLACDLVEQVHALFAKFLGRQEEYDR